MSRYAEQLTEASNLLSCEKFEEALALLLPLVKLKEPPALSLYGAMFQIGLGVERDLERAVQLLTEAYELGDGTAAHNLGTIFCMGEDPIEQDIAKGKMYFRKAKEMGAQYAPDEFYE